MSHRHGCPVLGVLAASLLVVACGSVVGADDADGADVPADGADVPEAEGGDRGEADARPEDVAEDDDVAEDADDSPGDTGDADACECLRADDCPAPEPCRAAWTCVDCSCMPGAPLADDTPCDDGDPCTTGETCLEGACTGGEWVCFCEEDADCDAYEDGDLCNGTLHCVDRRCVVDPDTVVVCDSSHDTDCRAAVCNPEEGTCALQPRRDGTTCDDGNACTSGDACRSGTCTGTTLACNDGNLCTDDSCDPATGCVFTNNTAPCDDGNPCTGPDRCSGGACVPGPLLPHWFPDDDNDTYGDDLALPVCAATAPERHVDRRGDCCDSSDVVRPNQTEYFGAAYTCTATGRSSFDYNCDDVVEPRWTTAGSCTTDGTTCRLVSGWVTVVPAPPSCGASATFITGCGTHPTCTPATTTRQQECR